MRNPTRVLLIAALVLVLGGVRTASAFTLSLTPATQNVSVGGTVIVDALVSGLGDGVAPSIGTYDISVSFDTSLMSFAGLSFGTGLDVLGLGPGEQDFHVSGPGVVNVFENSFDTISDLNSLQPDTFTLFRVIFNATASGTGGLGLLLGANAIISAEGNVLTPAISGADVHISAVPLPASGMLLLCGLAAVFLLSARSARERQAQGGLC